MTNKRHYRSSFNLRLIFIDGSHLLLRGISVCNMKGNISGTVVAMFCLWFHVFYYLIIYILLSPFRSSLFLPFPTS
jgi:hypothetical protein